MTIKQNRDGSKLTLALEGRLDTTTAPQLEEALKTSLAEISDLVLDFEKLEYISSDGLRVVLAAQKQMQQQGSMVVCHVNEMVMEVFDLTGFADILTIK